jgi:hypothetical protein
LASAEQVLPLADGSTGAVFVGCILRAQITQAEVAAPLQRRSGDETSINEAIDSAEALCKVHGISWLATYDTEPLAIEAKVISPFGPEQVSTRGDTTLPEITNM